MVIACSNAKPAQITTTAEKKDALFNVNFETLPVVKKYFLKKENEALAVSFQTSATATF